MNARTDSAAAPAEVNMTDTRKPAAVRLRWIAAAAMAVLAVLWPLLSANTFYVTLGTMVVLSMIGASSLNLIIRTGHISLAHAAFMGVAAYVCVLLQIHLQWAFVPAMLAGCVASGLLGLLLGPVVLRLTGKYFVLVTFLLGEIIRMVFLEWRSLTGGANGIENMPPVPSFIDTPLSFYYFSLFVAVLSIGIVWRILCSETGRAIDAVREADRIAECSGIPVIRLKVAMFALACALVGLQGALQVYLVRGIDPSGFSMEVSLGMVVMNVLGGMYYLIGPLLGAAFMVALPELLRGYVELQQVIFGITLIVVMAALPGGIIDLAAMLRRAGARALGRSGS